MNPNGIGSILWVEVGNHVKDSLPHQTGDILKRPSNIRKLEIMYREKYMMGISKCISRSGSRDSVGKLNTYPGIRVHKLQCPHLSC